MREAVRAVYVYVLSGFYLAHGQYELCPRNLQLEEVEQLGERVRSATGGEGSQFFLTARTPPGRRESGNYEDGHTIDDRLHTHQENPTMCAKKMLSGGPPFRPVRRRPKSVVVSEML